MSTATLGGKLGRPLRKDTFTPFLYNTATVLRCYSDAGYAGRNDERRLRQWEDRRQWDGRNTARPRSGNSERDGRGGRDGYRERPTAGRGESQRRTFRPRSPAGESPHTPMIPFKGLLPTRDPSIRLEGTTMTPKELWQFESLLKKTSKTAKVNETMTSTSQTGRKGSERTLEARKFPEPIRALVMEAEQLRNNVAAIDKTKLHADISIPTDAWYKEVKAKLDEAATDLALWHTLQHEVLGRLATLNEQLEMSQDPNQAHQLATSLPDVLLHYMKTIQTSFPGSPLGLVLLRTLKKMGSSAFALAATTEIYNEHMRILYTQNSDLDGIAEMLAEMDTEVYEFNRETQSLLSEIINYSNAATRGAHGPGHQALWLTDRKIRGITKLERWRVLVDERVNDAAVRETMRSADIDEEEEE